MEPGRAVEGAPTRDAAEQVYRSLVEGAGDLVVAFDGSGAVRFVNQASSDLLDLEPHEVVGRNVFDFMHPDDMERALRALAYNVEFGSAPGTTAFRLRHRSGRWVYVDMTGGHASGEDGEVLFSSFSRPADDRFAMSETLARLLDGASLGDALRPVCDTFAWRANGSQVGIAWMDGNGRRDAISTGIDLDLVGCGADHEPSEGSPWGEVRHGGTSITDLDLGRLDPRRREAARALGLGAYWIEPITSGLAEPALITVWTKAGSRPPLNHALAMETAHNVVELILRWAEQQRQLDHAAFHDPLTGTANRTRFFQAIEHASQGGAVLYCDLDGFKAVNDRLGHAAGDDLLVQVAGRLQACVRTDDLVARLGGDEFAVLCPGATAERAGAIAARIDAAIAEPFPVGGQVAQVGISVGIGHAPGRIGDDTVEQADQELYRVKAGRRRPGQR